MGRGLQWRFREASLRSHFDKSDLKGGREFVHAYEEYIHYVEDLHQATQGPGCAHPDDFSTGIPGRQPEITAIR